jgi:hypothetical protein
MVGASIGWPVIGFPELTQPYEGFHGMVFAEESTGRAVFAFEPVAKL